MPNSRAEPYNDLPQLPPVIELETKKVLKKAISANKALAELRVAGDLIPNQAMLIRAILLQEAKHSSEIENIVTTNDQLYRAFSGDAETADPSTKEVLRYEESLWDGYLHLNNNGLLSAGLFTRIASIVKGYEITIRKLPGTRVINRRTDEPIYAPPEGETLIRALLDNLSRYIYTEDDVDPLIKMAVIHYQFEAIHPFPDGNGRSGRVINLLYLLETKLLNIPVLYLSGYIIQNKGPYYEGLRRVTEEKAWEDWIIYVLDGVEQTARDTGSRIAAIREAMLSAVDTAKEKMARGYSKELIELIFQQPYTRISAIVASKIAKRDAASAYLQNLEQIGLLRSIKFGRERLYINHRLLDILAK